MLRNKYCVKDSLLKFAMGSPPPPLVLDLEGLYNWKPSWVMSLPYLLPDFHTTSHIMVFLDGICLVYRSVSQEPVFRML